jgi:hypothetical protein
MRLGRLGERHLAIDAQTERAVAHPAEDVPGAPAQLVGGSDVVRERGPREKE